MNKAYGPEDFITDYNVSRETLQDLKTYESLLKKWTPAINLISASTTKEIWRRHFGDSAQLLKLAPNKTTSWLDLGSGAGFPGLVVAIMAKELAPAIMMTLVESDIRKATFLMKVAQETETKVKILNERVEKMENQTADVISARALAPINQLLEYSDRHLAQNGTILLLKGQKYKLELTEAAKYWTYDVQKTPSLSSFDGVVLSIGELKRARRGK